MVNQSHFQILKKGVDDWNQWRQENPSIRPNLSNADLTDASLANANFIKTNFFRANLKHANLSKINGQGAIFNEANLRGSNFSGANVAGGKFINTDLSASNFAKANFSSAFFNQAKFIGSFLKGIEVDSRGFKINFTGANLTDANLTWCQFNKANFTSAILQNALLTEGSFSESTFRGANLTNSNLSASSFQESDFKNAIMVCANLTGSSCRNSDFTNADLSNANLAKVSLIGSTFQKTTIQNTNFQNCSIYGISVWDLIGEPQNQQNLNISLDTESEILVDNIEVAQFLYLLINNEKLRKIIETMTSKIVLILGRFSEERKPILDAIRINLRNRNLIPVLFDFEKPASRDITETVSTLAHLSKFIIADITDARTVAAELEHIIPILPSIPIQPILRLSSEEFAWSNHIKQYPWVLQIYYYQDLANLLQSLDEKIIMPSENFLNKK